MMRFSVFAASAVIIAASVGEAHAEDLTIAVSTPEVQISSNFAGTGVTIFGVIGTGQGALLPGGPYDIAVLVLGPPQDVVTRRKDNVLGIWINDAAETFMGAPTFYALDTSVARDALAEPPTLERLGLGFDNIAFTHENRTAVNDAAAADFRAAYIRLKQKAGLFSEQANVEFIGDNIFRTTTWLPANTPAGRYTVLVYLFSNQALIAHAEGSITVSKAGLEQVIPAFARSQALIYGLICAALGMFVGWLGGVIFRRD
jgi:uncharacterized protein (TIGR02186 family)